MQVKYLGIFGKHRLCRAQQKFCPKICFVKASLEQNNIVKCQRDKLAMPTNCYDRNCHL